MLWSSPDPDEGFNMGRVQFLMACGLALVLTFAYWASAGDTWDTKTHRIQVAIPFLHHK